MVKQGWSGKRLRKTAIRSGLAALSLVHLGSFSNVVADCDCDACSTKPKCAEICLKIPKLPCCLGNGLFDHFNRMASSFGANLHRGVRDSCAGACDCESAAPCDGCDSGCASCATPASAPMMMSDYSSDDYVHLEGRPTQTRAGSVYSEERTSPRIPSSEVPMTIPQLQTSPKPVAKPGDPFLDEARFTPKSSRLPSSIAIQEVHIAKYDPKSLATKTASTRKKAAGEALPSNESAVIHVGATVSDNANSAVQFAR